MSDKLPKIPKMELPKMPKMPNLPKINIPKNLDLSALKNFLLQLVKQGQGGFKPPTRSLMEPGRPMKFPYTFSAKIAQFPWRFYMKHNWMARYYPFGILASLPVFYVCHKLANSKENKAYWRELRRKEKEAAHHKFL